MGVMSQREIFPATQNKRSEIECARCAPKVFLGWIGGCHPGGGGGRRMPYVSDGEVVLCVLRCYFATFCEIAPLFAGNGESSRHLTAHFCVSGYLQRAKKRSREVQSTPKTVIAELRAGRSLRNQAPEIGHC